MQCTKQHVVDCPDFSKGGSCPRGAKCPLRHRKRTKPSSHIAARPPSSLQHVPPTKTPLAFRRLQRRLVPESGPVRPRFGHWVVKADADDDNEVSSCDQDEESCDAGHQVHYSPLDPNFPGKPPNDVKLMNCWVYTFLSDFHCIPTAPDFLSL